MKNSIVTISREFGSGGRTIGKKVAEKLGIPCYDSEASAFERSSQIIGMHGLYRGVHGKLFPAALSGGRLFYIERDKTGRAEPS